ncbi:MAG: hypothetical protein KGH59_00295 [Candidatus Micrarchaeota archaeon]|nr:hypothetical protein [Candidatus Micrarchaeota archaeon]MDE1804213.1 hypothetical protein [Candidatus Micrarchaeota archaeon]MDE1846669.1 hypothetical protein [Candidatus Micrarchaeota archaeon]
MGYVGYALIAIGIALLLFAFLLGYGLYISFGNSASSYLPQQTSTTPNSLASLNASVSGAIGAFTQNTYSLVRSDIYMGLEIAVLFLFASIGYKISLLGVKMNKHSEDEEEGKRK